MDMGSDDLSMLLEQLDSMTATIQKIRDMLPGDAAEEQSQNVDSATDDSTDSSTGDEPVKKAVVGQDMKKAAAVAMVRKQLG